MHADLLAASRKAGQSLFRAKEVAFLADSDVGGGKTLATMEAVITNLGPASKHADMLPLRPRINQGLDLGAATADFTTANIQAASTLTGLATLTQTDPNRTFGGPLPE